MNNETRDFAIRDIKCIVCRMRGKAPMPAAKHHLLSTGKHGNGKRKGEKFTVGLCDYHHQGRAVVGTRVARLLEVDGYGPSYADNAREFRALYPDELLLQTQNEWIERWKRGEVRDNF